jgi:hypothetical protein
LFSSAGLRIIEAGCLSGRECAYILGQYKHYVEIFPILLASGLTTLDTDELRMPIVQNLWEEHGSGDITQNHRRLYAETLAAIGGEYPQYVSDLTEGYGPAVRSFGKKCAIALSQSDAYFALGFLGPGTETLTSELFGVLRNLLLPFGGTRVDKFFGLHCRIDVQHSTALEQAIHLLLPREPEIGQTHLMLGLAKAVELEVEFWDAIVDEARKLMKEPTSVE